MFSCFTKNLNISGWWKSCICQQKWELLLMVCSHWCKRVMKNRIHYLSYLCSNEHDASDATSCQGCMKFRCWPHRSHACALHLKFNFHMEQSSAYTTTDRSSICFSWPCSNESTAKQSKTTNVHGVWSMPNNERAFPWNKVELGAALDIMHSIWLSCTS